MASALVAAVKKMTAPFSEVHKDDEVALLQNTGIFELLKCIWAISESKDCKLPKSGKTRSRASGLRDKMAVPDLFHLDKKIQNFEVK